MPAVNIVADPSTPLAAPSFECHVDPGSGQSVFVTHREDTTLRLTANDATWVLPNGVPPIRMEFIGATADRRPSGSGPVRGVSHYYIGADSSLWQTLERYSGVRYEAVYPGIDVDYDGSGRAVEYTFAVAPYADPSLIRLRFEGADRIEIDAAGNLVVHSGAGSLRHTRPTAYQESGSIRELVDAAYTMSDDYTVGIRIGTHDPARHLTIDPLVYSTYLGGRGLDSARATAIDASGNVYVVGSTNSSDFPTFNAVQVAVGGDAHKSSIFVTKVDTAGQLVYSTYLGGSGSGDDTGYGIAVDAVGNAYITGVTGSPNFPATRGAVQIAFAGDPCGTYGCTDAFITKLSPTGTLVYSTYLGGAGWDVAFAIALGPNGDAYVTGFTRSIDFPVSADAFQPQMAKGGACAGRYPGDPNDPSGLCLDAFVTRVNADGTALVYSTYLGGQGDDGGHAITVDQIGNAYVTGGTEDEAQTFPTTPGAFQTKAAFMFVSKLNPTGSRLMYSTLLGSTGYWEDSVGEVQAATGIAVDGAGNVFLSGYTATANLPTTPNVPFPKRPGGTLDAFVTKFNASGTGLIYSTFLGGKDDDTASAIAIDGAGRAYVTGWTKSSNFPVTASNVQPALSPGTCGTSPYTSNCPDAFITRLAPDGSAIEYSTYLGGSGLDEGYGIAVNVAGIVTVVGFTTSTDFPVLNALQPVSGDERGMPHGDAFVTKLSLDVNQLAHVPPRRR
jgi:hypothetical protein